MNKNTQCILIMFISTSLTSPKSTPLSHLCVCVCVRSSLDWVTESCLSCSCPPGCGVIHPPDCSWPTRSHTLREDWLSLPKKPPTLSSSSARGGNLMFLLHAFWNVEWLDLAQVLCQQPWLLCIPEYSSSLMVKRCCFGLVLLISGS